MSTCHVDEVADELYALAPGEFTATRTRYEKQARQAGERELSDRIHGLAKPTVAAWLANQLAREGRGELEPLIELGAQMREVTARLDGDALRALTRQRHQLVHALMEQARALARERGQSVSESTARALEDTLHAALVDEVAAGQLLAGRLTDALHRTGLGDSPTDAVPAPATAAGRPRDASELRQAEEDLVGAERALSSATTAKEQIRDRGAEANRMAQAAREHVEDLCRRLEQARADATDAEHWRRELDSAAHSAEASVHEAAARVADARRRRDRIARGEHG